MNISSSYEGIAYLISLALCTAAFLSMRAAGRIILFAAVSLIYGLPALVSLPVSNVLLIIFRVCLGIFAYLYVKSREYF